MNTTTPKIPIKEEQEEEEKGELPTDSEQSIIYEFDEEEQNDEEYNQLSKNITKYDKKSFSQKSIHRRASVLSPKFKFKHQETFRQSAHGLIHYDKKLSIDAKKSIQLIVSQIFLGEEIENFLKNNKGTISREDVIKKVLEANEYQLVKDYSEIKEIFDIQSHKFNPEFMLKHLETIPYEHINQIQIVTDLYQKPLKSYSIIQMEVDSPVFIQLKDKDFHVEDGVYNTFYSDGAQDLGEQDQITKFDIDYKFWRTFYNLLSVIFGPILVVADLILCGYISRGYDNKLPYFLPWLKDLCKNPREVLLVKSYRTKLPLKQGKTLIIERMLLSTVQMLLWMTCGGLIFFTYLNYMGKKERKDLVLTNVAINIDALQLTTRFETYLAFALSFESIRLISKSKEIVQNIQVRKKELDFDLSSFQFKFINGKSEDGINITKFQIRQKTSSSELIMLYVLSAFISASFLFLYHLLSGEYSLGNIYPFGKSKLEATLLIVGYIIEFFLNRKLLSSLIKSLKIHTNLLMYLKAFTSLQTFSTPNRKYLDGLLSRLIDTERYNVPFDMSDCLTIQSTSILRQMIFHEKQHKMYAIIQKSLVWTFFFRTIGLICIISEFTSYDIYGNIDKKDLKSLIIFLIAYIILQFLPTLCYLVFTLMKAAQINKYFKFQEEIYNHEKCFFQYIKIRMKEYFEKLRQKEKGYKTLFWYQNKGTELTYHHLCYSDNRRIDWTMRKYMRQFKKVKQEKGQDAWEQAILNEINCVISQYDICLNELKFFATDSQFKFFNTFVITNESVASLMSVMAYPIYLVVKQYWIPSSGGKGSSSSSGSNSTSTNSTKMII